MSHGRRHRLIQHRHGKVWILDAMNHRSPSNLTFDGSTGPIMKRQGLALAPGKVTCKNDELRMNQGARFGVIPGDTGEI